MPYNTFVHKKSMKTYTLTITEAQAQALSSACEFLSRIQLGQWREITDWLPLQKPIDYTELHQDEKIIGAILSKHMIENIDGGASSLGIGHPDLPKNNGVLYDLHCVIRKKLAWERAVEQGIIESEDSPRKWPEMMQVCYDDPMKWGDEPLAKMDRVK
jgi:hypothetical protein